MPLPRLFAALLAFWLPAAAAWGQSPYSPAITVNDDAVTYFELDQRQRLLDLFNTPGDLAELAREQLVDDRLKAQALRRAGLSLSEESLAEELAAFAGRADMSYDQFLGMLRQNGVEEQTLRDFVRIGVSWRDYVRARYGSRSQVTERDVDLEVANLGGTGSRIEVLLNEIIIPAPPDRAAEARRAAEQISAMRSFEAFQAAARQVSALPSREQGGAVDWAPVSTYPGPIAGLLLDLEPGEVTRPLPIRNGIALFQLRAVREVAVPVPAPALVDYAVLQLPGAGDGTAQAQAARLIRRVDTCDDLYGNVTPASVARNEAAPEQIPGDIALELAKLDPGEVSTGLRRGDALLFVMLCDRTPAVEGGVDRDAVESRLRSERLSAFADRLLAQLRADATIRGY